MADINTPVIVDVPLASRGAPVAIAATASPGTLIYAVPSATDAWYEVTLIVSNLSFNTDYVLVTEWGDNRVANQMVTTVLRFSTVVLEPRVVRGLNIYGFCLTVANTAGVAGILNVQVKSFKYAQKDQT